MDFLKDILTNEEIKQLEIIYDPFVIESAINNKENIINNINSLYYIGINNIKDILFTNIEPLFLKSDIFKQMINKYNIDDLRNKIMSDSHNIDLLYFS